MTMDRLLSVRRARSRDARYAKSAAQELHKPPVDDQRPLRRARSRDRRNPLRLFTHQPRHHQQQPPQPQPQPQPPPPPSSAPLSRSKSSHSPLDIVPEQQSAAELRRAFAAQHAVTNTTTVALNDVTKPAVKAPSSPPSPSPARLRFSRASNRPPQTPPSTIPQGVRHLREQKAESPDPLLRTPPTFASSGEVPHAPTPPSVGKLNPIINMLPTAMQSAVGKLDPNVSMLGTARPPSVGKLNATINMLATAPPPSLPDSTAASQPQPQPQLPSSSVGSTIPLVPSSTTGAIVRSRMPDRARSPIPLRSTEAQARQGVRGMTGVSSDVKALCEALRGAVDDAGRAESVLSVLAARGVHEDQVSDLLAGGAVHALGAILRTHASSARISAHAAWCSAALCRASAELRAAGACADLVPPLVHVLTRHGELAPVVECALRALHGALGSDLARAAFAPCDEHDGVDATIQAMGRHADIAAVQALGAAVLSAAVRDPSSHAAAIDGFALDALVTAMRGFTDDPRVQRAAAAALRNVAAAAPSRAEARAAADSAGMKGGVNAAVEALAAHAGAAGSANVMAVTASAAALRALLSAAPSNTPRLANSADWAAVLMGTLGAHSASPDVQHDLLVVLATAAETLPNKVPKLVAAGALGAALAAMRRNVHSRAVLGAGARVARALLGDASQDHPDAAATALRDAGGVATLIDMLHWANDLGGDAPQKVA